MLKRRIIATLLAAVTAAALVATPADVARAHKKKGPALLRVLVTNDDGVGGEGIDLLVEALQKEPSFKITVVAPADDKSGTGSKTTPGTLTATETTLLSGYDATAVNGFPADSVIYALDELGLEPQFVFSGINVGQNIGPAVDLSGTIGAARVATSRGIPAIAVSQGLSESPDFQTGVAETIKWFKAHRKAITKAKGKGATTLTNLNIPTCLIAEPRGVLEDLPVAASGDFIVPAEAVHCDSTLEDPADDVTAFNNGYVTISEVPATAPAG